MNTHFQSRKNRGFTLMELMVTMAILTVILTMALQVTDSTRTSIRVSEAKSMNDAAARKVFDQMKMDFSQMMVREDARIEFETQDGNDEFAFLAHSRGLTSGSSAGERMASLVSYQLTYDSVRGFELMRGTLGHDFASASTDSLNLNPDRLFQTIPADNLQALSKNILRLEVEYLVQGVSSITRETVPPKTSENLKGVIVTLVTLDDRGRRTVGVNRLQTLASKFPDAPGSGADTLKRWSTIRDEMAKSGFSGLPKDSLQSVRCYQRTFLTP